MWIIRSVLPEFLANSFLFGVMLFAGIFSVNVSVSAERVYCGELVNDEIYIETDSINVNEEDGQFTVQTYSQDGYYGTYFFTYMQNMNDFMYTLVNENNMRRGKYISGSRAGGLLSRAPQAIKMIFAETAKCIQG